MKYFNSIILSVLLVLPQLVSAQQISESEAKNKALSFLAEQSIGKMGVQKAPVRGSISNLKIAYTSQRDDETNYYVFNVGDNDGFIIASADERVEPILGYVDNGSFNSDNIPDNLKWWLNEYDNQINNIRFTNNTQGINDSQNNWADIEPLIKTKWGQGEPYNKYTPTYLFGEQCLTGCVATAMAQIIRFHEYPQCGQGYHSYQWMVMNNNSHPISVDFSQSHYDYSTMSDAYSYVTGIEAGNQISKLMYDCGVSVDMDYGPYESGASIYSVPNALVSYFCYDNHTINLSRQLFSDTIWTQLIYNELANGRPLIYSGLNRSLSAMENYVVESSAHAFICDGYHQGFFHFNFGWDGVGDGFFKLSAINNDRLNYNSDQQAIFIYPHAEAGLPYPFSFEILNFSFGQSFYHRNEQITATFTGKNLYPFQQSFRVGCKMKNLSTGIVTIQSSLNEFNIEDYSTQQINDVFIETESLENGIYEVSPVFYDASGSLIQRWDNKYSYTMTIADTGITIIANQNSDTLAHLIISSINVPKAFYKGHGVKIDACIKNDGNREYFGTVYLNEINSSNTSRYYDVANVHIPANDSVRVTLSTNETNISWLYYDLNSSTKHFEIRADAELLGNYTVSVLPCDTYPIERDGYYFRLVNDDEACFTYNLSNPYTGVISIPASISYDEKEFSVTSIDDYSFNESITLGSQVSAYNLRQISIPASVIDIGTQGVDNDDPPVYVVHWSDPSQVKGLFSYHPTLAQATLIVPPGTIDAYIHSDLWKNFYEFSDGVISKKPRIFYLDQGGNITTGGGEVDVYVNGNNYHDPSVIRRDNSIIIPDDAEIKLIFKPSYGNELLKVYSGDLDISHLVENNELILTDSVIAQQGLSNTSIGVTAYMGFEEDGVLYSCISDKEVILLNRCKKYRHSWGYDSLIISDTIVHDRKEYKIGNFDQDVVSYCTKVISVPWNTPLDIWELGINDQAFERTLLNVPQGTFETYANHELWGKFAHIMEDGVLKRDLMSALYITTGISKEPYTIINGERHNQWETFRIEKSADLEFTFFTDPYSWFKVSRFEACGMDLFNEIKDNHYTLSADVINDFLNDHTGGVNQELSIFVEYAIEQDGAWFYPTLMDTHQLYYNETNTIDTTFEYSEARLTKGRYKGDVIIPDTIHLIGDSIIPDSSTPLPYDGKTTYRKSSNITIREIESYMLPSSDCTGLQSLEIPTTITSIKSGALVDDSYKYLYVNWETPISDISEDAVYTINGYSEETAIQNNWPFEKNLHLKNATLMVPVGTFNAYKQHPIWGRFEHIVENHDWRSYEQSYPFGDANFDGIINMDDLTSITTNLVGLDRINSIRADINGDSMIDVADYVLEANMLQHGSNAVASWGVLRTVGRHSAPNKLDSAQVGVVTNGYDISIETNLIGGFSAFQFYITLPDSMTLSDITLPFSSETHQLTWSRPKANTYRFVCVSPSIEDVANSNGKLLTFSMVNYRRNPLGTIKLSNIKLVDKSGNSFSLPDDSCAYSPYSNACLIRTSSQNGMITGGGAHWYGDRVTLTAIPIEGYHFERWSDGVKTASRTITVNGDATYRAEFAIDRYVISFVDFNGVELEKDTVDYGSVPVYSESIPIKQNNEYYSYSFCRWFPNVVAVTNNATYVAQYDSIPNKYLITYYIDGHVYRSDSIAYGSTLSLIDSPTKDGFIFSGWSEIPATMPANDVEVTGSFSINSYKLVYKVDGAEYKALTLDYGTEIIPETNPAKEGYTFSGWSEIPATMPANNVEVTGSFTVNMYLLKVLINGEIYYSDSIAYGTRLMDYLDLIIQSGIDLSQWELYDNIENITMPAHDVIVTGNITVDGIIGIESNSRFRVYNLAGKFLGEMTDEDLKLLEPGVYIVNNRKIIVK